MADLASFCLGREWLQVKKKIPTQKMTIPKIIDATSMIIVTLSSAVHSRRAYRCIGNSLVSAHYDQKRATDSQEFAGQIYHHHLLWPDLRASADMGFALSLALGVKRLAAFQYAPKTPPRVGFLPPVLREEAWRKKH